MGLPTAELKVERTVTAAEAWPSSFPHHLLCKEESRERPQHMLLTCWSHGLRHSGTKVREGGQRSRPSEWPLQLPCLSRPQT